METRNEVLRTKVQELRKLGLTTASLRRNLGWGRETIYKWMKQDFNLKEDKLEQLEQFINNLGKGIQ